MAKTRLCLIFVTLKQDYDRPFRGRARWNCWAKVLSSVYWSGSSWPGPLHKIVRLTGFGAISTVVAGMLGALIGVWLTPGARDIIPAVIDLSPLQTTVARQAARSQSSGRQYAGKRSAELGAGHLSSGHASDGRTASDDEADRLPFARGNLQLRWLKRSAATICRRISSFACCIRKAVSDLM